MVYERKIWSVKRRYCLRKEDFVYERKVLAYICNEMNKLRNEFLSTKGRFLSMKGRFYLRKEDICGAQVVSFHIKGYHIQ